MVVKSGMLGTICGVHIPSNLWLLWVDLWQSQLHAINYQILWSGFSGWYGSHVPHFQSFLCPHDGVQSGYQGLVHRGQGLLQGVSCASVAGNHSVGLI